jgi:hypothetical protein
MWAMMKIDVKKSCGECREMMRHEVVINQNVEVLRKLLGFFRVGDDFMFCDVF